MVVATLVVATTMLVLTAAASAQDDNYPPGSTTTTSVVRKPPPDVSPKAVDLPFTGGEFAGLVVVGLTGVVIGIVLVRAGRRNRADLARH